MSDWIAEFAVSAIEFTNRHQTAAWVVLFALSVAIVGSLETAH